MKLDISASAVSSRARSIRTQKVRKALRCRVVVDDCAGGIRQPDVELVVNTRFSRVSGANGKVDVTELVRPGSATDLPSTDGLTRRRASPSVLGRSVAKLTSPNWFVLAVPQIFRVPMGWPVCGSVPLLPSSQKKYPVMLVQ